MKSLRSLLRFFPVVWLSVGVAFGADKAEEKPNSNEKLPPAKEIIARYVKEIGGEAAFAKHKSQYGRGKFALPAQQFEGEVEVFATRPDKFLMKIKLPGLGESVSGYDGTVGFSSNPATGPMLLDGKALAQLKEQADFDAPLHAASKYKSMETVERTEFEKQDAYKVKLVNQNGDTTEEFYDVKSGLLIGTIATQESPLGAIQVTSTASEYKKFDGILLATKLVQKMAGLQQVVTLSTVEFDKVDPKVFELPPDIKALTRPKQPKP